MPDPKFGAPAHGGKFDLSKRRHGVPAETRPETLEPTNNTGFCEIRRAHSQEQRMALGKALLGAVVEALLLEPMPATVETAHVQLPPI